MQRLNQWLTKRNNVFDRSVTVVLYFQLMPDARLLIRMPQELERGKRIRRGKRNTNAV